MKKLLATVILGTLASLAIADAPAPAPKWRVAVDGQPTNDGQVQFRVTPHEGEAVMVTVEVKHGRPVTYLTRDISDAFKATLPKKRFKSDVIAEKVLLKAGPGEADFALELVESTLAGSRIFVTAN
jgi:hypothetical protein